ncbi:divergent PAP2 family protein [Candidatus Falkowbacteria bacterium]|jgi:acid phosphatase family membrane protein YuiD|nr:divergent PAP2 family protein [Candidatus Falkowbacteria bacterium]
MYIYFITPIIAFSIAQGTKVFLRSLKQKITWRDIFSYSDMPSGHAAVVVAMATILALRLGIDSPIFAATFVYAAIVITDAVGLRNYLGQHGKTLNILVKDLKEDEFLDHSYPKLLEKIGHTPLQVLIGGIIGVTVSVIMHLLF